jgi:hypothetical protein
MSGACAVSPRVVEKDENSNAVPYPAQAREAAENGNHDEAPRS